MRLLTKVKQKIGKTAGRKWRSLLAAGCVLPTLAMISADAEAAYYKRYANEQIITDEDMARVLLDNLPAERMPINTTDSKYNLFFAGMVLEPQELSAQITASVACYKYEVFRKNKTSAAPLVTYLVAHDLSQAYSILPNGQVKKIYAEDELY